jgi:hypothetical protein
LKYIDRPIEEREKPSKKQNEKIFIPKFVFLHISISSAAMVKFRTPQIALNNGDGIW